MYHKGSRCTTKEADVPCGINDASTLNSSGTVFVPWGISCVGTVVLELVLYHVVLVVMVLW